MCRQLQLGTFGFAQNIRVEKYHKKKRHWFNYVSCNGNESSLFHCDHRDVGSTDFNYRYSGYTYYTYVAGVKCGMAYMTYMHANM